MVRSGILFLTAMLAMRVPERSVIMNDLLQVCWDLFPLWL